MIDSMRKELSVSTSRGLQLRNITAEVTQSVRECNVQSGICVVYCPHTTAGLVINENADPDVATDLERAFEALVPGVHFAHFEGNSPAHFLCSVTRSSIQIMVEDGRLQLGRWQGIFFCEFDGPRQRKVWVKVIPG